ncbi:hypothetical protein [Leptospira kanakyensis]|uniref:hypothetical protein n=1 Tax=Leptospira kanakyensis TaxID=2484968 RepID=UPI00223CB498|nr:hypothetical protein [Leptospira kanakyensis]MCW7471722.1 hypothetical protein [Leptospira kanakyensis]
MTKKIIAIFVILLFTKCEYIVPKEKHWDSYNKKFVQYDLEEWEAKLDQRRRELKTNNIPLMVRVAGSYPNSAGGVDANIYFENLTSKSIKYVNITSRPFNRVGDLQKCSIRSYSSFTVQSTGPFKPGDIHSGTVDSAWYNHSIHCLQLVSVEIIYMDNKREILRKPSLFSHPYQSKCPDI